MARRDLKADWHYPTNFKVGPGRVSELPGLCKMMGIQAPLLITDPGLADLPSIEQVMDSLRTAGLRAALFSAIKANPSGENVEAGVSFYRDKRHDGVIAFGGGSALDAGKAVALMVGQRRPLWDFEDIGDNWTRVNVAAMAPVIALPTTAGTGSEAGRAAVITDTKNHIKRIIFHPAMLPAQVILDPELTVGLPASLTAATGMDALSHNLEALCSRFYHPMAEGIAVEGIRLVHDYLPRAVANGEDIEARTQMLVCSSMGATAFQKGLGAMHALSHPLGALYDAHHGTLNAILMPYVLKANRSAIEEKIARLSRYLNLASPDFDSFLDWVIELRAQSGIPNTLASIHIGDDDSETVGMMAAADPSAVTNPLNFHSKDYERIFRDAVQGRL